MADVFRVSMLRCSTVLAITAFAVCGQSVVGPSFEVATVKPNRTDGPCENFIRYLPGGRISAQNVSLRTLIRSAYRVRDFQVADGPVWINTARYDVVAKAVQSITQDQLPLVLQAVLADRFRLILHRETREVRGYLLLPAKQGIKLPESKGGCLEPGSEAPLSAPGQPQPGFCGTMVMGVRGLNAKKIDMTQLANGLSGILGRNVIDKSGFTGKFDVHLEFARDEATTGLSAIRGPGCGPAQSALDSTAPSIFTAVREQLGLKLEAGKGPADFLILDRADKPSEN